MLKDVLAKHNCHPEHIPYSPVWENADCPACAQRRLGVEVIKGIDEIEKLTWHGDSILAIRDALNSLRQALRQGLEE